MGIMQVSLLGAQFATKRSLLWLNKRLRIVSVNLMHNIPCPLPLSAQSHVVPKPYSFS